jgi:hypothetical protein
LKERKNRFPYLLMESTMTLDANPFGYIYGKTDRRIAGQRSVCDECSDDDSTTGTSPSLQIGKLIECFNRTLPEYKKNTTSPRNSKSHQSMLVIAHDNLVMQSI